MFEVSWSRSRSQGPQHADSLRAFATRKRRRTIGACLSLSMCVLLATLALPVSAQSANTSATMDEQLTEAAIGQRLEQVTEELSSVGGTDGKALTKEQVSSFRQLQELLRDELALLNTLGSFQEAIPQSAEVTVFTLGDRFEELDALDARDDDVVDAAQLNRAAREKAKQDLAIVSTTVKSGLAGNVDAKEAAQRVAADWRVRLAQERLYYWSLKTRLDDAEDIVKRKQTLRDQIAQIESALRRSDNAIIDGRRLAEREGAYRRQSEKLNAELATLTLRLTAAEKRFSATATPDASLLDQVKVLARTRDALRQRIALIEEALERLTVERTAWERWHGLLVAPPKNDEIVTWVQESKDLRVDFARVLTIQRGRVADLVARQESVVARLNLLLDPSPIRSMLEGLNEQLAALLISQRAEIDRIGRLERLLQHVVDQARNQTGRWSPLYWTQRGSSAFGEVWTYQVTVVDGKPITIGSIFTALLLVGLGLTASRFASRHVGRLATRRLHLDSGAAAAVQTLTFYLLLVAFTLLALKTVNFPLTAFTVLGGALAIGIGFGSQNVMNNFISGLILMLERPVRVGDVVEVDGNHGTVENIGARSTQIRSTDGRHVVVPNSFFLESNVVNWTLSDDLIRAKVTVGVAYGSPTETVLALLHQCVEENPVVLKNPPPIIIFSEFGDNSLNFELRFWVHARSPMDMAKVASLVRLSIDQAFAENQIVIAFPQRDVHLDASTPIDVRVHHAGDQTPQPGSNGDESPR